MSLPVFFVDWQVCFLTIPHFCFLIVHTLSTSFLLVLYYYIQFTLKGGELQPGGFQRENSLYFYLWAINFEYMCG